MKVRHQPVAPGGARNTPCSNVSDEGIHPTVSELIPTMLGELKPL
jgi:hypothetical protein